jgi:hypothetical protein
MVLIHDDDLARIDGLGDDSVSKDLYCAPVKSIFSFLQSLEALEPDAVLRYLRSFAGKPFLHEVLLGAGELLPVYDLAYVSPLWNSHERSVF